MRNRGLKCAVMMGIIGCFVLVSARAWGKPGEPKKHATPLGRARKNKASSQQATAEATAAKSYGNLPLQFEENRGQTDPAVQFISRGRGYSLLLDKNEAVFILRTPTAKVDLRQRTTPVKFRNRTKQNTSDGSQSPRVVGMKLNGAKSILPAVGEAQLPGLVNYFIGNDPEKWHRGVPTYLKVRVSNIYEGIDLVYHSAGRNLEYDFELQAGANPKSIEMEFEGVDKMELDASGQVNMKAGQGAFRLQKPAIFQMQAGQRKNIQGDFEIRGTRKLGLRLKNYDPSKPLVVDPVLVYSSYLGGSGEDWSGGFALDSQNNIYLTGGTTSSDFPMVGSSAISPTP